jgi:hypothetical protein
MEQMQGLFGTSSPSKIQQDYLNQFLVSPAQMGQQGLLQQVVSLMSNAGANIGAQGSRMLGGKLAGEIEASYLEDSLAQVEKMGLKSEAEKMAALGDLLAQKPGMGRQAMIARQEAVKLKKQGFELKGLDNADKARQAVADTLAKNPNATSQELYAAAAPFSSDPEEIIKTVVRKEEKEAARQAKMNELAQKAADKKAELELKAQDRLDQIREQGVIQQQIAAMNGASREEVARIGADARMQTSLMMGQIRVDIAKENNRTRREIEASKRNTGVLAPSLQKTEDTDLESIDKYEAMSAVLDAPVQSLTPNDKGVVALRLNPAARASYAVANFLGRSTSESRSFADLQASIAQAVNIKTDAAKGVQTDKDVVRFANALIEANSRNDTTATREALVKFQNAAKTAAEATKVRVNSRRQAQNVGVYFTDVATPAGTSPSGANQNTTPPMYATNGTQRIVSNDGGKTWKEVR